jgi:hypothetical protein
LRNGLNVPSESPSLAQVKRPLYCVEYLEVLDDAAFGGTTPVTPRRINLTDPASRWTAATREAAFYSYSTNYLIDLDHAVIVDVEATTSVRQAEVTARPLAR